MDADLERRIRNAWLGRVSGCMLGKPVEILSMRHGHDALRTWDEPGSVAPGAG